MAEFESKTKQQDEGRKIPAADKPKSNIAKTPVAPKNLPTQRADNPIQNVRELIGKPFVNFLKALRGKSQQEAQSLRQEIHNDYFIWAETYKKVHKEFSELWDFFNLIEHDSEGWFRVAPKGTKIFIDINEEGYSFSAGVEENYSRGAPMPKKWLIVSLAHSDHWVAGLGDERRLGRSEPIDDSLIGLKKCNPKDLDKASAAARELRQRAENTPLVFQMYDKKIGQRGVKVPLSVLEKRSLVELCKGLFLALNKDVLEDISAHLPAGVKIELLK